jgi:hypothetical protein
VTWIVAGVLGVVLVVGALVRIVWVNSQWPDPRVREFAIGEAIPGGDVTMKVVSSAVVDGLDIVDFLPEFTLGASENGGRPLSSDQVKMIVVEMEFSNQGAQEAVVEIGGFRIQWGSWSNGLDPWGFRDLNAGQSTNVKVPPGTSTSVRAPYFLKAHQLGTGDRVDVDKYLDAHDGDLVLLRYPLKYVIRLAGR